MARPANETISWCRPSIHASRFCAPFSLSAVSSLALPPISTQFAHGDPPVCRRRYTLLPALDQLDRSASVMTPQASRWSIPLIAGLAAPFGLYFAFIFLGAFPFFQRQ